MFKYPITIVLVLLIGSIKLFAQTPAPSSLIDQKGTPLFAGHYIEMEGTPYLFEKFIPGKVITDKGKIYDNVKLKYNAYDNMLSFVYNIDDEPLKFEEPIKQFTLFTEPTMAFVNGYPKIDRQNESSYYQVINYGKVTLLKFYRKEVRDSRNLAVAGVKGAYENLITYYTYSNGQLHRFKLNKESVLKAMPDKAPQVTAYISTEHIDLKYDDELKKVFSYYNSL